MNALLFYLTRFIPFAHAQTPCSGTGVAGSLQDPSCIFDSPGGQGISAHGTDQGAIVVSEILDTILLVAGGLAILAFIYSGILYITAYGDEKKAQLAKRNATWAAIGVVVIVLSYVLVNYLGQQAFLKSV